MLDLADAVLTTGTHETPDLSAAMVEAPAPAQVEGVEGVEGVEDADIIGPDAWATQWGFLHDMFGGMVQARSGAPCPLGDQARSEGGMLACEAAYSLIAASPARSIILGRRSSFIGQVFVVGAHGFACVQMVKAARAEGAEAAEAKRRAEASA